MTNDEVKSIVDLANVLRFYVSREELTRAGDKAELLKSRLRMSSEASKAFSAILDSQEAVERIVLYILRN